MDTRLALFLQYDYAEGRDLAKTFLGVSGALLAGGVLFAKEYMRLHRTDDARAHRVGMVGLYAFGAAGLCSGAALLNGYFGMIRLVHRYGSGIVDDTSLAVDLTRQGSNGILLIAAAVLMVIGLYCLFKGAYDSSPSRRSAATQAAPGLDQSSTPIPSVNVPVAALGPLLPEGQGEATIRQDPRVSSPRVGEG